ncbi:MAG TPA: hypothetical protein VJR48_04810 [Ktedonobacterales bacterium]|nr:hypothetical protein [Ktedonobacterales bacterium]
MMTPPQQQPQTDDIRRDLQASLEARRELGPGYDEQFLNALVEKLTASVHQQIASAPRPPAPSNHLGRDQRTAIAICSLIFAIPLIAIAGDIAQLTGIVAVALMVALVNFFAAR